MKTHRLASLAASLALAVALAGCGSSSDESTSTVAAESAPAVTLVAPQEAQEVMDGGGVTILDVRTPEEFAEGHVEGAENIDFYAPDFASRIRALDPGTAYVVYCRSGNRSGQAAALMAQEGFTDVTDVDGGIVAWEAAGLPTVGG